MEEYTLDRAHQSDYPSDDILLKCNDRNDELNNQILDIEDWDTV